MKKNLALIMVIAMICSCMAGCGTNTAGNTEADKETTQQSSTDTSAVTVTGTSEAAGTETAVEVDASRPTTSTTGERYDMITIAINADILNMSPLDAMSGNKQYVNRYVYECLFDSDGTNYSGVLAKSWEEVDELHYNVTIYDNIYDSEGNHITADDVVFNYNTAVEGGYVVKYNMFDSIKKVDDYTVEFTWTKAINQINELEHVWCHTFIYSQKAYEEGNFNTAPVATGPYTVKEFTIGSKYILEANDNYWQTDESLIPTGHHQSVQTIVIQVIPEAAQQVIALQNGDIDWGQSVASDSLSTFENNDDYTIFTKPGKGIYFLLGNLSGKSIWSDINFRLAVFYALDNGAISKANSQEACYALTSPYFPDYYAIWSEEENYETVYDTALAAEYLEKSAYAGESVKLICGSSTVYKNTAVIIQALLAEIGIKVEIESAEDSLINSYLTDDTSFDLYVNTTSGSAVVSSWNRLLNNTDFADGKAMGFNDDAVLFEMFQKTNTVSGYTYENTNALKNYVMENAYTYVYSYQNSLHIYNSKIAELGFNADGWINVGESVYYLD